MYKLDNGEVWLQSKYFYEYNYSYRPRVPIEAHDYREVMHVEGFDKEIHVHE